MFQLPPNGSLSQHVGFQDELWVGTQPNHAFSFFVQFSSDVLPANVTICIADQLYPLSGQLFLNRRNPEGLNGVCSIFSMEYMQSHFSDKSIR